MKMERYPLFRKELLSAYLAQFPKSLPGGNDPVVQRLSSWTSMIASGADLNESNLEQAFNQLFFVDILGYAQPPGKQNRFQILPKTKATGADMFPDFLLGQFQIDADGSVKDDIRLAVGELKGPSVDLDKVDPGRLKSPVEQAFEYAVRNGLHVKWVLVSNMKEVRVYHHSAIDHFERWWIPDFVANGTLTDHFWQMYYLLHRDHLIGYPEPSQLENLLQNSLSARLRLTDEFYAYYRQIVRDSYSALSRAKPELAHTEQGRIDLVKASQQLIHRGLMTCFFSDHPAELLPHGLLGRVIESAASRPSVSSDRIYEDVKDLFRAIDVGTAATSATRVYGYNGGLFQAHAILDGVRIPDGLFLKDYKVGDEKVHGIFGFRKFDFYTDFNEHLLGRIFEESVGDLEAVHKSSTTAATVEAALTREKFGLYYTREGLTNFLAQKAFETIFTDLASETMRAVWGTQAPAQPTKTQQEAFFRSYLQRILAIRVADISCGSGAFLVSSYRTILREINRVVAKLDSLRGGQVTLADYHGIEADALRACIHGNDILPESVEVAKLSLWLGSARKNTRLEGLEKNFLARDALADILQFPGIPKATDGFPKFDLVIGNPPWGAEVRPESRSYVKSIYPTIDAEALDSYELFILTALKYLRPGGVLAYVLPHTLLLREHTAVRKYLLENTTINRYHNLGADWFGPAIRFNTTVLQASLEQPNDTSGFRSMVLVEEDRRRAVRGETNLALMEESYAFAVPQSRCRATGEVELFRYVDDDAIMAKMEGESLPLGAVCDSGRGVELGKDGHVIRCPNCAKWDAPPGQERGGKFKEKKCKHCDHKYVMTQALAQDHLIHEPALSGDQPFVDGDSFKGRYRPLAYRGITLGFEGIAYKPPELYDGEKVLIRQAGVGLTVALDGTGAYCPQSVYVYRFRRTSDEVTRAITRDRPPGAWMDPTKLPADAPKDLDHRFLLALLNSRTFQYYVFKRFGELDAAQAFAKLTHDKIRSLPIPLRPLHTAAGRKAYAQILENVDKIMATHRLADDYAIERAIQSLFGLNPQDKAHIQGQLGLVGYHQAMQDLFPIERPRPPERKTAIIVSAVGSDSGAAE
ncbi:MAG: N-6 DNA methylase [Euryarchaeota archaeon]|nr:N-6 DNA methylase [Euryarchaeota archaeon]